MQTIKGQKGGGGNARTPVESPDSIQSTSYAKILLALGEGEFNGGLDGTRIFLDGTPLTDANGNANFSGITWEFRPGTPDQSYIPGFPGVENEITVSTELTSQTVWVRSLTNTQLSAVRLRFSWSALQQQLDNGDVVGYRIEYAIDVATDGGSYQERLKTAVDGKTTTKYERSHRIDLPKANTGWQIRVRRITPNSTSNRIADRMVIEAITEVIDAKLRYPETALLLVQFDAKQFQNIPVISCEPDGRIIRIPSNYDPIARVYSGVWDGTFKWAWTNNPAWIYYDIQVNERFGLGNRIRAENLALTKWDLYRISQYCDQLVPDGRGGNGTEPRFLCDVYIQSQEEAWTVLNDIAAIFRGATFWANNQMNVIADMPRDIDYIVTRANVKDGKFTYSNASEKTHYSTAMVSWSDPANGYQDAVEVVSDNKLVKRYGIKQADVTAIGCIRQTDAIRRGKWILHTNDADRAISYTMGLDGDIPLPGSIVGIADSLLAGRPLGGRISAVAGRNITLDRASSAAVGERLIINLPSGKAEGRTIAAVNEKIITVTAEYSETPIAESVWAVDATDLALQLYRIIGVVEGEDGASFDITGIEYDPNKWAKIDTGARIESRPISVIPPSVQPSPTNVKIGSYNAVDQGINITTLQVTWDSAESAIAYEAQWRRDSGNWINAPRTSALGFEVSGIYAGQYQARVRAINASEISSRWSNAQETTLTGKDGNPPKPVGLIATGINWGVVLEWGFPAGSDDTLKTEIRYTANADFSDPLLLSDVPYPSRSYTQMGLRAGQEFWYSAQLVDRLGNESGYTDWIRGMANDQAADYLQVIAEDFVSADDGKQLLAKIDANIDGILQNALANNAAVEHQYAQFGEVRADILSVKTTIAGVNNALAEMSTQVQSQIGDVVSTLHDKMTAVVDSDGATAIHTLNAGVRINGEYYSAGMSIAVLAQAGQPITTRVAFNANQFVLMSGSGSAQYSPFSVINGQAFLTNAFIQDGSITNAKIANASITRGKISETLSSDNFVSGQNGLQLNFANGTAEFNNVTVRGTGYFNNGIFRGRVYVEDIQGDIVKPFIHGIGSVTTIEAQPYNRTIYSSPIVLATNAQNGSVNVYFNGSLMVSANAGSGQNNNAIVIGSIPAYSSLTITSSRDGEAPTAIVFNVIKSS
ncbi:host specificity protein J [Dickeya oryzae]|uniref:Host specificity protein J n=1 Tax=Dickeya oryzae TaxID=1240404 RepID=A0ABS5B6W3_9GAMM|nr:host specificity protein J [Dickeya oryzae]MBP2856190.1 host specificity protein J [Dickeya oryzae]